MNLKYLSASLLTLACTASAGSTERKLAKAVKSSKSTLSPTSSSPTPAPTESPVVTPFPVNPFSAMGLTHNAIRGWIFQMEEDCLQAVENWTDRAKLDQAIATTETLLKMINTHMAQEDGKFFDAFDNTFACVAYKEKYREEHDHDEAEQVVLTNFTNRLKDPNLTLSQAHEVCAETFTFASEHEAHLKHEEKVLSPLTKNFPAGSGPAIVHHVIGVNFDETHDFFFETALDQLVKREPLSVVGSYVAAVKRILTPEQYALVLPGIIKACGSMWPMVHERLIGEGGDYTAADEAKLPAGIFDPINCASTMSPTKSPVKAPV
ncbi:hypothetical protein ACHAWO_012050 [Cyclotella atomus]|uniref:Hemerythrin-like domain-containing protein n=1 Tax=Cyclotella atomus TaxID=382360 RepID=A0ABD3QVP7_9STRA